MFPLEAGTIDLIGVTASSHRPGANRIEGVLLRSGVEPGGNGQTLNRRRVKRDEMRALMQADIAAVRSAPDPEDAHPRQQQDRYDRTKWKNEFAQGSILEGTFKDLRLKRGSS